MKLEGIYAPIPSPFNADESLACDVLARNLELWARSPLDGLVVAGSNGELPFLTAEERAEMTKICKKSVGSEKHVITGGHFPSTRETIDCAIRCADAGADAMLVLPPHFFKGNPMAVAMRYFEAVAYASPIPIVLYNMPANTGVNLDAQTVVALSQHTNIIGIKDSAGDLTQLGYICAAQNDAFSVFCGSGNILLPSIAVGARGGTLAVANLYPASCKKLMGLHRAGNNEEARALQARIMPVSDAVTRRFGVPGLKYAMDSRNLYGGPLRSPMCEITSEETRAEILKIMDDSGLETYETWRNL